MEQNVVSYMTDSADMVTAARSRKHYATASGSFLRQMNAVFNRSLVACERRRVADLESSARFASNFCRWEMKIAANVSQPTPNG